MSNQSEGGFITLPLSWLAKEHTPWTEMLDHALGYGFCHFYKVVTDEYPELQANTSKAEDFVRERIGFTGGSLSSWKKSYEAVASHERSFTSLFNRTYHPRVDKALMFEARDGNGITEHQLRVHIALLSAIGGKPFVRLGWPPIQWRAIGHLKPPPPQVRERALSRGQIDRALRDLVSRGLWTCYAYGRGKQPGCRYWTNRRNIDLEQLVKLVHAAKDKASRYNEDQRRAREIAAKLRSAA